jgi:SpoVK/Ycf46/Vps4 family AAA+-type ATPase
VTALARNEAARGLFQSMSQRRVPELVLPPDARQSVGQLVEEHYRRDLLRSHGIESPHRVLLVGPPGGGKTSLAEGAEGIAAELAVPLLSVRYEGLIGRWRSAPAPRR